MSKLINSLEQKLEDAEKRILELEAALELIIKTNCDKGVMESIEQMGTRLKGKE